MPDFRFRLADWTPTPHHLRSIYVSGLEGIPTPCKVKIDKASFKGDGLESELLSDVLCIARNEQGSGNVYFIYPLLQRGEMMLCTGTLPARDAPYDLLKELARGTLHRLRNQLSIWQEGGLEIDNRLHERISVATQHMAAAIMCNSTAEQDRLAAEVIELSVDAIFELAAVFSNQIVKYRREQEDGNLFWLANSIGSGNQSLPSLNDRSFDLVRISGDNIENPDLVAEVVRSGKPLIVGPWLDASVGGMPEDLLAVGVHAERRHKLLNDCRRQLKKIPENTSFIHLMGGLNGMGHRHLSYPQQMQLAVDLLEIADDSTCDVPVMISFDFPWAERLAGAVGGTHPLQIADSLLRQGVRISCLGLEINLDYWPQGSVIRDPFQWIDMIDIWAQLDLPLVLYLRTLSGASPVDPQQPIDRSVNQQRSNVTEQQRVDFLNVVLPMMVARPTVQGMIWPQWQDGDDPRFPHGGLVDGDGREKPVSAVIERLRSTVRG